MQQRIMDKCTTILYMCRCSNPTYDSKTENIKKKHELRQLRKVCEDLKKKKKKREGRKKVWKKVINSWYNNF